MKCIVDRDMKHASVWKAVEVLDVVGCCAISNVIAKLVVSGMISMSFDMMKEVEIVGVGQSGMGDRAIHVVLFIAVVSFKGFDADFTVCVDVRREIIKVVAKDSSKRNSQEFHAVVGDCCVIRDVWGNANNVCDRL